ncbi:interferon-induced 35 kDa protein homolog [Myxocyprinus asiaticus]|uniref:interferon-induced 35 kDa protein homolog n=1 Tax=Myxocyprinus asiaticus TaxID=70543 RepID=UPI0022214BF9|nr:interferon-induced 35 kDa protein homolog [Myxocyprinus asiaticus]XP_051570761.1 interferon-induced 35 kDa protein homolog [Myxocyprinus asiaticus]
MSSEEDFSLVTDGKACLEDIIKEINKYKTQHEAILKEQKIIIDAIDNSKNIAKEFKQCTLERKMSFEEDSKRHTEKLKKEKDKKSTVQKEQNRLRMEILKMKEELESLERKNNSLKQQTEISTAVPEKKVVFHGEKAQGAHALSFDVNPHIVYPMEGGTALITFEEEEVAQNILSLKDHQVQLGECTINVVAKPIQFLVPRYVEIDTQVCPCRILITNLPKKESEDRLLDKLEIYFSKKKNGGGEVVDIEMLHDSGTVVITFLNNDIAKGLTDKQDHEVEIEKIKHKVKVTPFLNGKISRLQTCDSVCQRTVQLTGIPAIMDPESLQDHLEIHFQKTTNGGGEVDSIIYNPLGDSTLALFEEDPPKGSQSV